MRLTKKTVDGLKSADKAFIIWDASLGGFGVKVSPSGRKAFLVQYRISGQSRKTRRFTLGAHGKITCEQARVKAKNLLAQATFGDNPLREKDELKSAKHVSELLELFYNEHVILKLAIRTQEAYNAIIKKKLPKKFLEMPIKNVSRQDVAQLHHSMREIPTSANKVLAMLSKFFNWAEKFGYRPDHSNPCRHVEKFKEIPRQRFLSPAEQKNLWRALDEAEKHSFATVYSISALRVISLTGARLREILNLKWEFVDLDRNVLNLPKSKTGAKTIYLNEAAADIIRNVPRQLDNEYVFCGIRAGQPIKELQKAWQRIRASVSLDDVRIHDLRHTFASVAVQNGMSLPLIGALLGHSQPRTTARYAHLAADPLKKAAEQIGRSLLSLN